MDTAVIVQESWDVAQGLMFQTDSAKGTNENLFEKNSAGQIHEDAK